MLTLKNVTLVSIDSVQDWPDKRNIRLAAISRLVPHILKNIEFGNVLMVNPFGKNSSLLSESIPELWGNHSNKGVNWYSDFVVKKLPYLIDTPYYMIIQWDGYPVELINWDSRFFEYDFIGGGHSLLNGGFSLRRTRTMREIAKYNNTYGFGSEDGLYSAYLDNKWRSNYKTPFKLKWPWESALIKFALFNQDDWPLGNPLPSFGWHANDSMSRQKISNLFNYLQIFNQEEIKMLTDYYTLKDLHYKLDIEIVKLFQLNYNEEFFKNY